VFWGVGGGGVWGGGRGPRRARPGGAGPAPPPAALGTLLGGGFSAALVYQGALWLSGCGSMNAPEADCLALSPPTAYSWLQLAFAFEAVIVLVKVDLQRTVLTSDLVRLSPAAARGLLRIAHTRTGSVGRALEFTDGLTAQRLTAEPRKSRAAGRNGWREPHMVAPRAFAH
jgi:hypothetical protein